MQIIPLNLDSVLLLLHNSKLAYLTITRDGSSVLANLATFMQITSPEMGLTLDEKLDLNRFAIDVNMM